MVSAVNNANVVPATQSSSPLQSTSSSANADFQQALGQYMSDTTTGVGATGANVSSTSANPSQTLGSDLISSLLQMQL